MFGPVAPPWNRNSPETKTGTDNPVGRVLASCWRPPQWSSARPYAFVLVGEPIPARVRGLFRICLLRTARRRPRLRGRQSVTPASIRLTGSLGTLGTPRIRDPPVEVRAATPSNGSSHRRAFLDAVEAFAPTKRRGCPSRTPVFSSPLSVTSPRRAASAGEPGPIDTVPWRSRRLSRMDRFGVYGAPVIGRAVTAAIPPQ